MPRDITSSESVAALDAGTSGLKIFPASALGFACIAAIKAVLPADTQICALDGVSCNDFVDYMAAGIQGFNLGSSLYLSGDTPQLLQFKAEAKNHSL